MLKRSGLTSLLTSLPSFPVSVHYRLQSQNQISLLFSEWKESFHRLERVVHRFFRSFNLVSYSELSDQRVIAAVHFSSHLFRRLLLTRADAAAFKFASGAARRGVFLIVRMSTNLYLRSAIVCR